MANRAKYNKHEIQKGWNHKLAPKVRELGLSPLTTECLQGICMWRKLVIYKGQKTGFRKSLEPQLGYIPEASDIKASLIEIETKGYARCMGIDYDKAKRTIHWQIDEMKIKRDAISTGDLSMSLFAIED